MAKNVTKKTKRIAKGFTLVEVLVALLLVSLVLPAVMRGVSACNILVSDSDRRYEALNLAQAKLAEILLDETWKTSSALSGDFEDEDYGDYVNYEDLEQYEWKVDIGNWTETDVVQIDVYVYWQQRNRQREIYLSTLVNSAEE